MFMKLSDYKIEYKDGYGECPICHGKFKSVGLGPHLNRLHNPNFIRKPPKVHQNKLGDKLCWNAGLTKETDSRLALYGKKLQKV